MLISGISAMVMIVTFIINYAIYLRTSSILAYWGVDSLNIDMNNANFIYMFVGAFVYYMMIMFIQPFILNSCETYVEEMKSNYYILYFRKHIKKETKKYKKILKKKKEKGDEYIEIQRYLKEIKNNIKESKKISKKIRKKICKKLIVSLIIAFLGLTIASIVLILFLVKNFSFLSMLFASIISASITMGITVVSVYLLIRWPINKKIKKELFENKWDLETVLESDESMYYEYPIDKIINLNYKELFRDKALISLILQIVIGVIFLIVLVYPSSVNDMQKKQEFAIVKEGEKDYVIIYNNDNCYYLIEAIIDNKTITVDTTKQSVVIREQIAYENMKFESVIRYTLEEKSQ